MALARRSFSFVRSLCGRERKAASGKQKADVPPPIRLPRPVQSISQPLELAHAVLVHHLDDVLGRRHGQPQPHLGDRLLHHADGLVQRQVRAPQPVEQGQRKVAAVARAARVDLVERGEVVEPVDRGPCALVEAGDQQVAVVRGLKEVFFGGG